MALPMLALGGMSLLSGFMGSRNARKQNQASNALTAESIAVQKDQLQHAKVQDAKRNAIVDEINKSRRSRSQTADSIFDSLVRSTQSMSPTEGLGDALSQLEGTAGTARKSLRTAIGGGLGDQKNRALGLTTRTQRARLTNQIVSGNVARQQQMLSSLANPVDLAVPGALTSGNAANSLASGFGSAANIHARNAQQSQAAAGKAFSTGANLLGGAYQSYRTNLNEGAINANLDQLFGEV